MATLLTTTQANVFSTRETSKPCKRSAKPTSKCCTQIITRLTNNSYGMQKHILLVSFLFCATAGLAQNVGLSFSYFIPKDGYFSTPISPFSIRGLGVDLTRNIALETGASLYRMSGLNM